MIAGCVYSAGAAMARAVLKGISKEHLVSTPVSPSTDPVRPHRPAASTHHDHANATQPTQQHPSLLAAPGRPRWSLPKCWKSPPIIYPTMASETHLPVCDRPKLSSCHSSSILLVPIRTISRAVNRHQISIEPAAAASLPSATSCIAGLPTPADAGCGCGSPRPASANLYTGRPPHWTSACSDLGP
jgi:hypothetical protein